MANDPSALQDDLQILLGRRSCTFLSTLLDPSAAELQAPKFGFCLRRIIRIVSKDLLDFPQMSACDSPNVRFRLVGAFTGEHALKEALNPSSDACYHFHTFRTVMRPADTPATEYGH
jgi:hypothetical protein